MRARAEEQSAAAARPYQSMDLGVGEDVIWEPFLSPTKPQTEEQELLLLGPNVHPGQRQQQFMLWPLTPGAQAEGQQGSGNRRGSTQPQKLLAPLWNKTKPKTKKIVSGIWSKFTENTRICLQNDNI